MDWKRQIIWCECGAHALSVEKERWGDDGGTIDTSICLWRMEGISRMRDTFIGRLRIAWRALRGKLYHDDLILDEQNVARLVEILQAPFVADEPLL